MLAAAFQSYMHGGFTPAGGIFATRTSMAMLGHIDANGWLPCHIVASIVWVSEVSRWWEFSMAPPARGL